MYDLALINGRVIDPSQNLDGPLDVGVADGKIAALRQGIAPSEARQVVDVGGKIVTPGLIDLHTHVYYGFTRAGCHPDVLGVNSGVTTVVDAGSAGAATFGGFPEYVIPDAITNVYCLLHLARTGQAVTPEITRREDVDAEEIKRVVEEHRGLIRGLKFRAIGPLVNTLGPQAVTLAKQVAADVGLPLMVHIGEMYAEVEAALTREVLTTLERGDILSHVYTSKLGRVLGPDKAIMPELRAAMARGVILDAAFGRSNMSFAVARSLMEQGVVVDVISSDLTTGTVGYPSYRSLTEVMSYFLALGLSLSQVVQMTTANPARALGLADQLGSLREGREADVSILQAAAGDWRFADAEDTVLSSDVALVPVLTVKGGELLRVELSPRFSKFWSA